VKVSERGARGERLSRIFFLPFFNYYFKNKRKNVFFQICHF
jgi:hypothetical protein